MSKVKKKNSSSPLVFITGGHATPATACIAELRKRGYSNLIYIGQKKSILFDKNYSSEYRLVTEKLTIPFHSIIAGKFSRFVSFSSFVWLLRLPVGFLQAFLWHVYYRPSVVLTFGSHVGVPSAFWAWIFKTPVVAHEQTVTFGRANKLIHHFAQTICYSWKAEAFTTQSNAKYVFTGNPVRKEVFHPTTYSFAFSDETKPLLFITGGNQGAHAINEYVFAHLPLLITSYNLIHQTGSNTLYGDFEKAKEYASSINQNGVTYIPKDYLFADEIAEAYAQATFLLSRAGANTLTELLILGKKAVLIPITTSSGNEQFLNAQLLENLGLAVIQKQESLHHSNILQVLTELGSQAIKHDQVAQLANMHMQAERKIVDIVASYL
ncbi:MAG: UDP-N-acetylglucosamine--N-acetylmuramyl-(pentapeptide) pyrophosphoryl-undecaprenol N-acetylglucosamine transferase [Candidatus Dojkabacteria bacterium]